jgi:hypothetical protein
MPILTTTCHDLFNTPKCETFSFDAMYEYDTIEFLRENTSSKINGIVIGSFSVAPIRHRAELDRPVVLSCTYKGQPIVLTGKYLPRAGTTCATLTVLPILGNHNATSPLGANSFPNTSEAETVIQRVNQENGFFNDTVQRINLEDTLCTSHVHRALLHVQTVDVDNLSTSITYMCLTKPHDRSIEHTTANSPACPLPHHSDEDIDRIKTDAHNDVIDSLYGDNDTSVVGPVLARLFDAVEFHEDELGFTTFQSIETNFRLHMRCYRSEGSQHFPYTQHDHVHRNASYAKSPNPIDAHLFFAPLVMMHQWDDIQKYIDKRPHHCFQLKRCPINEFVTYKQYPGRLRISPQMHFKDYLLDIANVNLNFLFPPTAILSRIEVCSYVNDGDVIAQIISESETPKSKPYTSVSHADRLTHGTRNADIFARQQARTRAMTEQLSQMSRDDYHYYIADGTDHLSPRYRRLYRNLLVSCNDTLIPEHKYDLSDFEF